MWSIYFFYMFTRIGGMCGLLAVIAFVTFLCQLYACRGFFPKTTFICFCVCFFIFAVTPSRLAITMMYLNPILENEQTIDKLPDYIVKYLKNQVSLDFNKRDY